MTKGYLLLIALVGFISCQNKNEKSRSELIKSDSAESILAANQENEPPDLQQFFGMKYKDDSDLEPLKRNGGGTLYDNKFEGTYGILDCSYQGFRILFLERLLDDSTYHAEILDGIAVKVAEDEFISIQLCQKEGTKDMEIIALSKLENEKEYYDQIKKAWRANRQTGKIEEISPSNIKCMNEGYGI